MDGKSDAELKMAEVSARAQLPLDYLKKEATSPQLQAAMDTLSGVPSFGRSSEWFKGFQQRVTMPEPVQQQKPTLIDHLTDWMSGKTPLVEPGKYASEGNILEKAGSIGSIVTRGVANLAGTLLRPVANFAVGGIEAIPQLAATELYDKSSIEMMRKAYEDSDSKLAAQIEKLKGTDGGAEKIRRLREFILHPYYGLTMEPGVFKSLDKTVTQIAGEAATTFMLFGGLGKTIELIPGLNATMTSLGLRGKSAVLDAARTGVDALPISKLAAIPKPGLSNFLFNTAKAYPLAFGEFGLYNAAAMIADKPLDQITSADVEEAALWTGALALVPAMLAANVRRGLAKVKVDPMEVNAWAIDTMKAARLQEELRQPAPERMLTSRIRVADVTKKPVLVKKVLSNLDLPAANASQRLQNALYGDFSKVLPSDTIKTKSGVLGVYRGLESGATEASDIVKAIDLMTEAHATAWERAQKQANYLERMMANPNSPLAKVETMQDLAVRARYQAINEMKALESSIRELRAKLTSGKFKSEPLARIQVAADPGTGDSAQAFVKVPLADVIGGKVIYRTQETANPAFGEYAQRIANLRKEVGTATPSLRAEVDVQGIKGKVKADLDVAQERTELEAIMGGDKQAIAKIQSTFGGDAEKALQYLRKQRELFPGFEPRRVTVLDTFNDYISIFGKSGIDIKGIQEAGIESEKAARSMARSFELSLKEALKEERIGTFSGKGKEKYLEKVFDAVEKGVESYEYQRLGNRGKNLVDTINRISGSTLKVVNQMLANLGEKTIKGRANYMTHVLTDVARAYRRTVGGYPTDVESLMRPGRYFGNSMTKMVDVLLNSRDMVLPFKKDPVAAVHSMIQAHTRFAFLNPEFIRIRALVNWFAAKFGSNPSLKANVEAMEKGLDAFAGRARGMEAWKNIGTNFEKFLIGVDKFFGGTKFFSVELPLELQGLAAKAGYSGESRMVRRGIRRGIDVALGLPRNMKRVQTLIALGLSPQYGITNLTQFWLNTVPQLRGKTFKVYTDAAKSFFGAMLDFADPKLRENWYRRGIIPDIGNLVELEVGREMNGAVGSALKFISRWTEFVNRVGTFKAIESNAKVTEGVFREVPFEGILGKLGLRKKIKRFKGIAPEWQADLVQDGQNVQQALSEWAKKTSYKTQFRADVAIRSPLSENPIGNLLDHYNTFWRAQINMLKDSWDDFARQFGETDSAMEQAKNVWQAGYKALQKEGAVGVGKFLQGLTKSQQGAFIRYLMNASVMTAATMALGGSWAMEFFAAGTPPFLDGALGVIKGAVDGDMTKVRNSLGKLITPPSFPAFFDATKDTVYIVTNPIEAAKDPKKAALKVLQKAKSATYSPFKNLAKSAMAFEAMFTGKPVMVKDPRTGQPTDWIEPKDALATLLWGSRASATKTRYQLLDEASRLQTKAVQRSQEVYRDANLLLDQWPNMSQDERSMEMYRMKVDGKLDERFVDAFVSASMARSYRQDAITKAMSKLDAEGMAEFMVNSYFPTLDPSVRHLEFAKLVQEGIVSPNVVLELKKSYPKFINEFSHLTQ